MLDSHRLGLKTVTLTLRAIGGKNGCHMPTLRNIKHLQKTVLRLLASKRLRRTSQSRRLQNNRERNKTLRDFELGFSQKEKRVVALAYSGFLRFLYVWTPATAMMPVRLSRLKVLP